MLESKIEDLKNETAHLREAVATLTQAIQGAANTLLPAEKEKPSKAKKSEPAEKVEPEEAEKAKGVSRDDIQDLCMAIVRSDRAKKDAVKKAIANYNNAATLKDVPESDLPSLLADLEALK